MGRAAAQLRMTLMFVGQAGFEDAQAFIRGLEINPSGLLVHPIYGKRQATCSGAQGARLAASESNVYTMPVTFIENNLDKSIIGEQTQGVSAKAQAASTQADAVDELAEPYATALDLL